MSKTVLITGATSGIGREFAKRYAALGYRLLLSGRREERLEELQNSLNTEVEYFVCDLSKEEDCIALLNHFDKETIDIFINNAGFGTTGSFLETSTEKEISMAKVNDIAMHLLMKLMLQKMHKQGKGTVLNVASSAGILPGGPYMAAYYASKAYMVSLTRGVAVELKEQNSPLYVAALCPGPVDTEFNDNADVIFALKGISVETCVDECLKGMEKKKTIIVPTLPMRLLLTLQHIIPMPLLMKIVARQQKQKLNH